MINKNTLKSCHSEGFKEGEIYGAYKIFFETLFSEPRLRILNILKNRKKNVSEIVKELKMNQTAVSHDLSRLESCGFVQDEIEGRYRYYFLDKKTIRPLLKLIDEHMSQFCIHILRKERGIKK